MASDKPVQGKDVETGSNRCERLGRRILGTAGPEEKRRHRDGDGKLHRIGVFELRMLIFNISGLQPGSYNPHILDQKRGSLGSERNQ